MSALSLTPPNRSSEAWKYVTPSLLKELAGYDSNTQKPTLSSNSAITVSGEDIQIDENSAWKEHLEIIPFANLSPEQKASLPKAKMEEEDCFSSYVYTHDAGTFINISKNAPKDKALDLLIYTEGTEQIQNTRIHFNFPKLSEHQLNIHFKGANAQKYANLSELSFHHDAGSSLKVSVLCEDDAQAMTLTGFQHQLKRDSRLSLHILNTENRLTRHRLQVDLSEENAEVELVGLGSLSKQGSLHHHLDIRHLVPHCRSRQLFKTALAGQARSSFDGTINVSEKAIDTEADQLSRYLLLSPECRANAKPQLKIYADDVVCTHGSTIGQLEEEEMFYLQTRGLTKEQSHHLLARGFLEEILSEVPNQSFSKVWRETFLNQQFPIAD